MIFQDNPWYPRIVPCGTSPMRERNSKFKLQTSNVKFHIPTLKLQNSKFKFHIQISNLNLSNFTLSNCQIPHSQLRRNLPEQRIWFKLIKMSGTWSKYNLNASGVIRSDLERPEITRNKTNTWQVLTNIKYIKTYPIIHININPRIPNHKHSKCNKSSGWFHLVFQPLKDEALLCGTPSPFSACPPDRKSVL